MLTQYPGLLQSENSRRKELRTRFGEMVANPGKFDASLFDVHNESPLADVLNDLTPDEIAEWMIECVYMLQSEIQSYKGDPQS